MPETDMEKKFNKLYSEAWKASPDYSERAQKTPRVNGSHHFHKLDIQTITKMFELLKGNDDASASLARMVKFIYNITPPR